MVQKRLTWLLTAKAAAASTLMLMIMQLSKRKPLIWFNMDFIPWAHSCQYSMVLKLIFPHFLPPFWTPPILPPYFNGNYRVTQLNESRNIQLERETSWFPRSFTNTAYSLFPIKKCFFPLLLFFSDDQIGWRSAQHGHQCNQSHGTHSDTLSH